MLQRARLVETDDRLQIGADDLLAAITATCDRVEQLEPQLCALVPEAERRQRLLDAAASLHALFSDPTHRPPLFGTLVGIKDIVRVDGFATRGGSRLPAELFDGPEAGYVTALRAAGALVLGKTVTAEFAYFAPGPTRNPWNLEHTPGGSSSGSAAAVAAGYCPLAIGTQTIGSVIRPAAFCGIVGFKPTFGRIPTSGTIACAPSLDTIGLLAQDVRGIAVAAPLLCDNWQPTRSTGAPVLGVPDGPYLEQASPEGRAAFETHLARLEASGIEVRRIPALAQIEHIMTSNFRLMHGEMARVHADWFAQYADLYHERTAEAIRIGQAVSDDELELLRPLRGALRAELEGLMQTHGIDLWVCPAAPGPAPAGITTTGNSVMSLPWTFSGLPAITVPAGATDQGLPLGLQLVAAAQNDERLLLWADMLASIMAV